MIGVVAFGAVICGVIVGTMVLGKSRVVSSSVSIAAPEEVIYMLLADLKYGWPQWSPLMENAGSGTELEYGVTTSGEGATVRWNGKAGKGAVTLTQCIPLQRLEYETTMALGGMVARGTIDVRRESSATVVTWTDELSVGPNPMLKWLALAMDGFRKKNANQGLAELKRVAERMVR